MRRGEEARRLARTMARDTLEDNLQVRIHFVIVMIRWTGLAPWAFEFHFLARRRGASPEPWRPRGQPPGLEEERIFIELMTPDRKLKAFREGSK